MHMHRRNDVSHFDPGTLRLAAGWSGEAAQLLSIAAIGLRSHPMAMASGGANLALEAGRSAGIVRTCAITTSGSPSESGLRQNT